jgi:hypothetical protein
LANAVAQSAPGASALGSKKVATSAAKSFSSSPPPSGSEHVGALGAAPETLLPNGKWPRDVYDWVIMVSFDENGRVIPESTKRINGHLLQGDSQ